MRTVRITLDEALLAAVDHTARRLGTSRSAFTRQALRQALAQARAQELEARHRAGYRRKPVKKGEFDVWHDEQAWTSR